MTTNTTKFSPKSMQELIDTVGKLLAQVEALQRQANKPPQPQALPGFDMTWPTQFQTQKRRRRWSDPTGMRREMLEVLRPFVPTGEAHAVTGDVISRTSGMGSSASKCLHNSVVRGRPGLHRRLKDPSIQPSNSNPWLYWRDP